VLSTSGYTENAIIHHGRLDTASCFACQPYRNRNLARNDPKGESTSDAATLARGDLKRGSTPAIGNLSSTNQEASSQAVTFCAVINDATRSAAFRASELSRCWRV